VPAAENMTSKQMRVALGPASSVSRADGSQMQAIRQFSVKGAARAPFLGPAVFHLPIVLPKTAQIVSCRATAKGGGAWVLRVGQTELAADQSGARQKVEIDAQQLGAAIDLLIPELPFSDFRQLDLSLTVQAPLSDAAQAELSADLEFLLPSESGADYFNYIMTQA